MATETSFPFDQQGGVAQQTSEPLARYFWAMLAKAGIDTGVDDLGWYGTDPALTPGRAGNTPAPLEVVLGSAGALNVQDNAGDDAWALVAGYAYRLSAGPKALTPTTNPSGSAGDRIDSVVLQLNRSGATTTEGTPTNEIRAVIKRGVPAASPVPPALVKDVDTVYEMLLRSWTIKRGATGYAAGDAQPDGRTFLRYQAGYAYDPTALTTNQRDYVSRDTITVRAYAPPSGRIEVTLSARMENTVNDGYSHYSFWLRRGSSTTGEIVLEPIERRAAVKQGTAAVNASRTVLLTGLEPGLYTLVAAVRARSAGTATVHDPNLLATPMP